MTLKQQHSEREKRGIVQLQELIRIVSPYLEQKNKDRQSIPGTEEQGGDEFARTHPGAKGWSRQMVLEKTIFLLTASVTYVFH